MQNWQNSEIAELPESDQLLDELSSTDIYELNEPTVAQPTGILARARKNWREIVGGTAAAAAIVAGGYIAQQNLSGLKSVDITEVGRSFIDGAEDVAPFLLAGAGLQVGWMTLSRSRRTSLKMSWKGLTPNNHNVAKTIAAGALLPALGVGALSTALMIEDGIHQGANPNIHTIDENVQRDFPNHELTWVLQNGTHHFMNDSEITSSVIEDVQTDILAGQHNGVVGMAPFYRDLVTIPTPYSDNQAGMIISVDTGTPARQILPDVKPGASCEVVDDKCNLEANDIIVDEGEGFNIGDKINIRGHDFEVVAFSKKDQSLVNRLIAFTGADKEQPDHDYYGFVTLVDNKQDAINMINDLGLSDELEIHDTEEFLQLNENFWSHNGTPLLILLIADIAVFAGATFASTKNFEQERDRPVLATLRAIGATPNQLAQQEYARTSILTAKGIIPGAIGAVATTKFINSMLPGFEGEVTPKMILASGGLILTVQAVSTAKSLRTMKKHSLVEMIKETA